MVNGNTSTKLIHAWRSVSNRNSTLLVIPAAAGIQVVLEYNRKRNWMPVFTGMTTFRRT